MDIGSYSLFKDFSIFLCPSGLVYSKEFEGSVSSVVCSLNSACRDIYELVLTQFDRDSVNIEDAFPFKDIVNFRIFHQVGGDMFSRLDNRMSYAVVQVKGSINISGVQQFHNPDISRLFEICAFAKVPAEDIVIRIEA